ncbi:MAG: nucleotidyltransferase domain-containing protein [Verrucomicrobiota bacterium]
MTINFGLDETTLSKLHEFFTQYPEIEEVKIYGSRAKGDHQRGSDIDLAIYTQENTPDITAHILTELEDLPTPYRFDVTDYHHNTLTPLKAHIDRHAQTIYKKSSCSR